MTVVPCTFQRFNSIGVLQIATSGQDTLEYISGPSAIKQNLIEVTELSGGGSVNNLVVLNHSDSMIFFTDGDILAGAKQNRVLNSSILLAAESKTIIPVSCVERGRWRFTSSKFSGTDYTAPLSIRANKAMRVRENLRSGIGYRSNQGAMWHDVDAFQYAARVESPTCNLSDVYDAKAAEFENILKHFPAAEKANGVAIFIHNKLQSVETFNRIDIFKEYFPKILRGAALESMIGNPQKEVNPMNEPEVTYRTLEFFDRLEKTGREKFPGVGTGVEERFETETMTGSQLELSAIPVHLSAVRKG